MFSSDTDSECSVGKKVRYPIFKKARLDKNFTFKVGMEFKLIVEYKEAILEHLVLHGRKIKFVKNGKIRARVV